MLKSLFVWVFLGVVAAVAADAAVLTVDCDGGAQFTEIASAVEAAQSGDTIVVRECEMVPFSYGAFSVDGRFDLHIVAGDRTAIDGVGATPIGVGVGVVSFRPLVRIVGSDDCVRITSSTRVVVEGFELDGCGGNGVLIEGSTTTGIIGNKILGAGLDGVRDNASDGTYLAGNMVGQSSGVGVALSSSTNARVVDNLVGLNGSGQSVAGISVTGGVPVGETQARGGALSNSIVNNNIVENPGGCIFDAGGDTKIESNTCSGSSDPPRTITVDASAFGGEIVANIGIIDDPFMNSDEEDNCPVSAPC